MFLSCSLVVGVVPVAGVVVIFAVAGLVAIIPVVGVAAAVPVCSRVGGLVRVVCVVAVLYLAM